MLNLNLGARQDVDDTAYLLVRPGRHGHALFGPYERLEPGDYRVTFSVASPGETADDGDDDWVCGFLDVVAEYGTRQIAMEPLWMSSVRGDGTISLSFSIETAAELEYRVYVNGTAALLVADRTIVEPGSTRSDGVSAVKPTPFLKIDGLKIFSASLDDIHFVDEIFYKKAYNIIGSRDTCVLDIGMNVGLASLLFAKMPNVREVHGFEPFADTFARANRNFALNPELAARITPYQYGLGAQDETLFADADGADSDTGARSLLSAAVDGPVEISVRDASTALRPIIDDAEARGLQIVAKVDCEGSEFAIFQSLAAAGLFKRITALLVEWHRVFPDKNAGDLIAPLLEAGFIVIDLSPEDGNGFFYAIRAADAPSHRA